MKYFPSLLITSLLLILCSNTATAQGVLTNGWTYNGTIAAGQSNIWTFTASTGDNLVVKMGRILNGTATLVPYLRLYGPDGALLLSTSGSASGVSAVEVSTRATNSGAFTVVAANDESHSIGGNGTYRLTLAKSPGAVFVAPGDEGGPMTNGVMHTGTIDVGDLDVWTFTANTGDNLVVKMGRMVSGSSLVPYLRLYGPDGALLLSTSGSASGVSAVEVSTRATNSGAFTVVAAHDESHFIGGNGTYRLTLAKSPGAVFVAPGDEGGPMNGSSAYVGTIDIGDLDVFYFTACNGDSIVLQMDRLVSGSSLVPYLRLYGPDGALLKTTSGSASGVSTVKISTDATNSGAFTVVAAHDESHSIGGNGTYQLTANGLSDGFKTCIPIISGMNVNLGGVGGPPGTNFVLYTTTNIATSFAFWTPILTNQFNQFGAFAYTNGFNLVEPQRFYRLSHP